MANPNAFMPTGDNTTTAMTVASSAAVAIPTPERGDSLRIVNDAAAKAFIRFGNDSGMAAATAADIPLVPNSVEVMRKPPQVTHYRVILASGTGTLHVGVGEGV